MRHYRSEGIRLQEKYHRQNDKAWMLWEQNSVKRWYANKAFKFNDSIVRF